MSKGNKIGNAVFGDRLRSARLRRNLAQDKLGVLAGLEESSSSARISRYESGVHEPPFQFAQALAKVLGVSPAYFYCPDDRLADLILMYGSMPEKSRETLRQQAQNLLEET